MVQNIIKNKGGLHNRISHKIRLLPFNLNETELFLRARKINYTRYDILQLYMVMGGIPHYLEKIKRGKSAVQNIDLMCFDKDGTLNDEFNQLFASLFSESDTHLKMVETLSSVKKGITRDELIKKTKLKGGGAFSAKLEELIESGFVTEFGFFKNKSKQTVYRLTDEYSLFYLKFIKNIKRSGRGTWQRLFTSQSYISWSGLAFENTCLKHVSQIKKALGIEAVYSENSSWFNKKAQIDLLIDRDDNIINICEIKFYKTPFLIDKSCFNDLKKKVTELKSVISVRKNVFVVMITSFGVVANKYSSEIIENDLKMDCLFSD